HVSLGRSPKRFLPTRSRNPVFTWFGVVDTLNYLDV
ncbi:unnamed protein product, partial [Allacma fusca]